MSRGTTPNLGLGVWDDGDVPGAGSKTVVSTGLNTNQLIVDIAVGTEHNVDGTHKDDKIDGRSLKASVVDGSTLEASASTGAKVLRVKDAGITAAKMVNAGVFTGDATTTFPTITIGAGAINASKLATDAVETAKIKDGNVTTAKFDYKEIVFTISQAGAANPVITQLVNSSGATMTPTRNSQGSYNIAFSSAVLTVNKLVVFISLGNATLSYVADWVRVDSSNLNIRTADMAGALQDSALVIAAVMIRIYP